MGEAHAKTSEAWRWVQHSAVRCRPGVGEKALLSGVAGHGFVSKELFKRVPHTERK